MPAVSSSSVHNIPHSSSSRAPTDVGASEGASLGEELSFSWHRRSNGKIGVYSPSNIRCAMLAAGWQVRHAPMSTVPVLRRDVDGAVFGLTEGVRLVQRAVRERFGWTPDRRALRRVIDTDCAPIVVMYRMIDGADPQAELEMRCGDIRLTSKAVRS